MEHMHFHCVFISDLQNVCIRRVQLVFYSFNFSFFPLKNCLTYYKYNGGFYEGCINVIYIYVLNLFSENLYLNV